MRSKRLVQIGGAINFLFVVFHLAFWKIFDWPQGLASLSIDNRAIMQVFNVQTAYVLAVFAALSFAAPDTISTTKLGRSIGLAIAGFWIIRAANQAVFWSMSVAASWVLVAIFLGTAILYVVPALKLGRPARTEQG